MSVRAPEPGRWDILRGRSRRLDQLRLTLCDGRARGEACRALLDAGGFEPVGIGEGLIEARCH